MATLLSHALVAALLTRGSNHPRSTSRRCLLMVLFCSILPDFDVVGFRFGIQYGDLWGHRGMTHSLLFAAVIGILASLPFYRSLKDIRLRASLAALFFLATASHGFMDALTNGGLGVAFFSPFDPTRYFLPWRPIQVSPIGTAFFSARGLTVILSEVVWIGIPVAVAWGLIHLLRKRYNSERF